MLTIVTINRAQRRNAVTAGMMQELIDVCTAFTLDEATRAVVIRAEGRDFSVGADLAQPAPETPPSLLMRRRLAELGAQLLRAIQDVPQPTFCAVQGVATGAGACITSACDFRIGADNARLGYGEAKLGINLMWRALPLCVRLVGPSRTKQMVMTGKLFDAATLERWGYFDRLVPVEDLDAAASTWAEEFAQLPPISVQMIKRSVNHLAGALDQAIMHMDADQWVLSTMSEDYKEAVSAFFEKRTPTFTGQ
jgi:enoyl-CoA hydratase/carnithine racemase